MGRFLPIIAILALIDLPSVQAADDDLEAFKAQMKAEMEGMKANYEKRIEGLEKRIDTLESDNARLKKQKAVTATTIQPVSRSPEVTQLNNRVTKLEEKSEQQQTTQSSATETRVTANGTAIEDLERKLHEDATETRDVYRDAGGWPFDIKKLYDLPRPFEFHGYFRSGFGMNGEGGKMEAFKAPGAGAKYRLGNENDTYGELALVNNWLREDEPLQSPYVRSTIMISFSSGENFSYESLNNQAQGNDIALRQAFVEGGNVFQSVPEIRFWAGQRYYMRHDIHINDFYYLDMSGYGGGVEAIPLSSFGKLAVAWIGGSVDNYMTDHGDAAKQNIDLRLYDIKALCGKLTFWFDYSNTRGGEVHNVFDPAGNKLHIQSSSGWAIGLIHRTEDEKFLGGYNDFSIQYGSGAAYNFQSTLDSSGPDLDDAWRFRVTDHFTIQPDPHFAMQAVALYEETEFGGPNSRQRWASLGARPIYIINDRFSIALEAGVDWAKSEPMGTDGHLWKITLAPQLSRGGKFFSRPQVRAFITYARWSDGFRGLVGGETYANDLEGLSYGIQAETWW